VYKYFGLNIDVKFTCFVLLWSIDDVPCIYETLEGQPRVRGSLKGNMVGVTGVNK